MSLVMALAFTFMTGLFLSVVSFAQELPKPGTRVDKSNYKTYAHLFPEEFLPAFTDGFGLMPPVHMNVVASQPIRIPKVWLDYSAKNKGKYAIDANGNLTGGYNREGLPFPDLKTGDKDFATKFMWNYDCRWAYDETIDHAGGTFEKRKGEPVRWSTAELKILYFKNRMEVSPKPDLPNPLGIYKATMIHWRKPDSMKNTINLSYRYVDPTKPDDTYLYLPSLRRVLRAESGQRSTPLLGNLAAMDDIAGFDGRIPDFTYTLVKEQKVLAVTDNKVDMRVEKWKSKELPFVNDGYEIRDCYVIDIKPKDPKYPQSTKRIWIDKEDGISIYYVVTWDRAGKVWKMWLHAFRRHSMLGERMPIMDKAFAIDTQFGMATFYSTITTANDQKYTYSDFSTSNLLKLAR